MRIRLLFLVAAWVFAIPCLSQFVELTADVEIVSGWDGPMSSDPPTYQARLWKTRCVVGTNAWSITAEDEKTFPQTWSLKGSNIVWRMPDPPERKSKEANQKQQTVEFKADIETTASLPPIFRAAWLAFCSGSFLKQPHPQIPQLDFFWKETFLHFDFAAEPRGFQNKIVRFEDDLGLPISVDVLSKGGQPLLQYRLKYDHPASPASTNVAGWEFPVEFRIVQYFPKGATNAWEMSAAVHGKLTSIKVGKEPEPRREKQTSENREMYHVKAGGSFTALTNAPYQNRLKIAFRDFPPTYERAYFTLTNDEPEEILIWNVRVQDKAFGEDKGTDGFGWTTITDDYPECRDAALKPGQSTRLAVPPSSAPMWRVCVLYAKRTDLSEPKRYGGNFEVVSSPIDDVILGDKRE